MADVGFLRFLDIAEQGARCLQGKGKFAATEAGQINGAEVFMQDATCGNGFKIAILPRG